ncbi:MAG: hypothetical protein IJN80_03230 [Clostridia bacterium]|nr:hypothetical protein [Clostridia bacterium]
MKKIISIFLTFVLLLSCFSTVAFATEEAPADTSAVASNFSLVNSNKNLALYVDSNDGSFAVLNKKSGKVWYSNPLDWESDTQATGETRDELTTKMTVQYLNSSYSTITVTSAIASVIAERQGQDYILTYYFKSSDTNFAIPVRLSLKEDYLHLELMIDKIKELGDSRIIFVKLYQFFGAANKKDSGYVMIPDGTGSLMKFNSNIQNSYEFGASGEGVFYAPNPTEVAEQAYFINWNEALRLPIYGVVKNGDAYLNIIESGAAISEFRGYISGFKNNYNTAYVQVNIRDTQSRRTATGAGGSGLYYTDEMPENYIARYYFMTGDEADYFGMADIYRDYLIEEEGLTPVDESISNALCISLYGAVKKPKHFLGIPYTGQDALTTYNEAGELIDRLAEDKVGKTYINYLGWGAGGLETTMSTEFSANSKLGGKKELSKLLKKAEDNGVMLSFDVDLQAFYSNNSRLKKFRHTAYSLDSSPVTIYKSRISAAGSLTKQEILHQLIHPLYAEQFAIEFIKDASKAGVTNFSFNTIGDSLYCAYNLRNECTRDKSAQAMMDVYTSADELIGDKGIVSTSGGNGYAMSKVDNVVDAPVYGSHNNISLEQIPFYQIVFRGYVNLASNEVNLDSEQDDLILKLAETGMSMYYLLMDAESTSFHDTKFTASYACELDDHYDDMLANYKRLAPVYKAVGSSMISDYKRVSQNLKVTTFSNGAKVYVNYGDAEATVDGVKIGARNFTVVGGAEA